MNTDSIEDNDPFAGAPMSPVDKIFYDALLERVREFSEKATLRPSPFKLRCEPLRVFELRPVPRWRRDWLRLCEVADCVNKSSQ
jgi:hypothetical protein